MKVKKSNQNILVMLQHDPLGCFSAFSQCFLHFQKSRDLMIPLQQILSKELQFQIFVWEDN
jgi:hypothetical protein